MSQASSLGVVIFIIMAPAIPAKLTPLCDTTFAISLTPKPKPHKRSKAMIRYKFFIQIHQVMEIQLKIITRRALNCPQKKINVKWNQWRCRHKMFRERCKMRFFKFDINELQRTQRNYCPPRSIMYHRSFYAEFKDIIPTDNV